MEIIKILDQSLIQDATVTHSATPGAGKSWVISRILVCNTTDPVSGTDITYTMHLRIGGVIESTSTLIINKYLVTKSDTHEVDFGIVLGPTDIIDVFVDNALDTNKLNFTIMGTEVS